MRVISGGQTGADRGGLEAARDVGVPHGGWCPRGRRAEDGVIPGYFELEEHASADYPPRTRANVQDSDATIIFVEGRCTGGSELTRKIAIYSDKPHLVVRLANLSDGQAAELVQQFLRQHPCGIINIAGSRESKSPGIQSRVRTVMGLVLTKLVDPRGKI